MEGLHRKGKNVPSVATKQREYLALYYSGVGAVPWQDKMMGPLPKRNKKQQQQVPDDEDLDLDVPHLHSELGLFSLMQTLELNELSEILFVLCFF